MNTKAINAEYLDTASQGQIEIGLLDLLQILADNLRLLVLGPIAAGLVAFGGSSVLLKTYESTAILKAEESIANLMLSELVLDSLAVKLAYTPSMDKDDAHEKLKKLIKVSYNAKTKLVTVVTQDNTPEAAQSLATDLLLATFSTTQPRGFEKLNLEKQLDQLQSREKDLVQTAKLIEKRINKTDGKSDVQITQGYAELIGIIEKTQDSQIKLEKLLKGFDESNILQEPTLATKKIVPKRGLISIMATLASGFALLLFVFVRKTLHSASNDARLAKKLSSINIALRKAVGR
jgi:uncharacterized protein involved in exopolysaccharide biosynthesis